MPPPVKRTGRFRLRPPPCFSPRHSQGAPGQGPARARAYQIVQRLELPDNWPQYPVSLEGYIFRRLKVTSQEDWLTELVVMCPLGKFDLGNPDGFDPVAAFHDRRCNPEAPSPPCFLRQIYKRTRRHPEFLKLRIEIRQDLVRKTSADSAGEHEPLRTIVADQQRAEVFPVSFRECVASDSKLLRLGDLEFDAGTASPAAFVD